MLLHLIFSHFIINKAICYTAEISHLVDVNVLLLMFKAPDTR